MHALAMPAGRIAWNNLVARRLSMAEHGEGTESYFSLKTLIMTKKSLISYLDLD